jgi:hypothetical protein
MSDRAAADDTTMKVGLLMESAQVHQKLAEGQLEKLRAHTADLDAVVRDEIRRTLVDELQMLTAETTRATRALQKLSSGAAWRGSPAGGTGGERREARTAGRPHRLAAMRRS